MGSPSSQQTLLVMGRLVAMVSNMQSPLWSCRYDEVLVGAPYYSPVRNPEAGRVYVYRNNAVSSDDNGCTVYCVLMKEHSLKENNGCTVIVSIYLQKMKVILLSA